MTPRSWSRGFRVIFAARSPRSIGSLLGLLDAATMNRTPNAGAAVIFARRDYAESSLLMYSSVNQAGAGRLFERSGERAIFLAVGAGQSGDPVQVILRLLPVALFDLPQSIILPGFDVVRVRLERALVPDLRDLVVAELAIGIADQIGDGGAVVVTKRLQLPDGGGIVVAVIDRGIGGAITLGKRCVLDAWGDLAGLLLCLLAGRGRRRRVTVGRGVRLGDQGRSEQRHREHCQRQNPDREFAHASLLISDRVILYRSPLL